MGTIDHAVAELEDSPQSRAQTDDRFFADQALRVGEQSLCGPGIPGAPAGARSHGEPARSVGRLG